MTSLQRPKSCSDPMSMELGDVLNPGSEKSCPGQIPGSPAVLRDTLQVFDPPSLLSPYPSHFSQGHDNQPWGIPAPLLDTGARENSLSFCGVVLIVLFCLFVPSFHKEGTVRNWLSLSWCTLLQSSRSPFSSLLQHSKNDGWDRISQQHP